MRKLLLSALILFCLSAFTRTEAQSINNKSWKTYMDAPINDTVILHIYSDSSSVTRSNGDLLVQLQCKTQNDTLAVTDAGSNDMSCHEVPGIYKISQDEKSFTLTLINDACDGRAMALPNRKWTEVKK